MVGWRPYDPSLRQAKMKAFAERIAAAQEFGPQDVPLVLQFDERVGDLRPWSWYVSPSLTSLSGSSRAYSGFRPSEGGVPVQPDELDRHRYTHCFKAPSCLCAFENGPSSFSEAKIGLAQIVLQPGTSRYHGEYIAICATQQCGYIGDSPTILLNRRRSLTLPPRHSEA